MVEEVAVCVKLEGVIVWLMVAVACTVFPFRPRGSEPLTRLKVPVMV